MANANAIFNGAGSCSLLLDFSISSDMQSFLLPTAWLTFHLSCCLFLTLTLSFVAFGFSSIRLLESSPPPRLLRCPLSHRSHLPRLFAFRFTSVVLERRRAPRMLFTVYEALASACGVAITVNCRRGVKERSLLVNFIRRIRARDRIFIRDKCATERKGVASERA